MFNGMRKGLSDTLSKQAEAAKESSKVFIEQNDKIIELLNEHTKAMVSIYRNQVAIAKNLGAKLPEALYDMGVEE